MRVLTSGSEIFWLWVICGLKQGRLVCVMLDKIFAAFEVNSVRRQAFRHNPYRIGAVVDQYEVASEPRGGFPQRTASREEIDHQVTRASVDSNDALDYA